MVLLRAPLESEEDSDASSSEASVEDESSGSSDVLILRVRFGFSSASSALSEVSESDFFVVFLVLVRVLRLGASSVSGAACSSVVLFFLAGIYLTFSQSLTNASIPLSVNG